MDERDVLASRFEASRDHLLRVAYRMLGSTPEAEDAIQEAWLRISRAGADGVSNLEGWMTTIVGRVCLDALRARNARREEALGLHEPEPAPGRRHERNPEEEAQLADSVGLALMVVLETLEPAERVAFVLHDMFDLPFDEIAPIVGRSTVATRQLASRARRRVRGGNPTTGDVDQEKRRQIVEAFLAASKAGDFEALVAVLDPDVVFHSDAMGVRMGGAAELRGADAVARTFAGRAKAAVPGYIDGDVGILVPVKGRMLLVLELQFRGGRIAAVDAVADRDTLAGLELLSIDGGDPLAASRTGR
jgi:RNA polymerase sigma-70 factor, ECF subfamily